MARQLDGRASQANALVIVGMIRTSLSQHDHATTAYSEALDFYTALGHEHKAVEAHAGLAQIAFRLGDLSRARAHVEAILATLATHRYVGLEQPFPSYLVCYRVLSATNDPRATTVLEAAQQRLQEYADNIHDQALRQSFLENVPIHRELLRAYDTAR